MLTKPASNRAAHEFAKVLARVGLPNSATQIVALSLVNLAGYLAVILLGHIIFNFTFNLADSLLVIGAVLVLSFVTAYVAGRLHSKGISPSHATELDSQSESAPEEEGAAPLSTNPETRTHQVLQLVRKAERLDSVEKDLILQMSRSTRIDRSTKRLLTEMCVCTNQLIGQLAEMDRQAITADASRETSKQPQ